MTPPVFAHGSLRLYLLALLEERPRHGYELIQALSDRFGGTYSPSAGTIYPRLAKLEEEGLVTKVADGRKTVYEITDAGRAELDARRHQLDSIESEVTDSVRRLAAGVRAEVDEAMRSMRAELASAAREAKRAARDSTTMGSTTGTGGYSAAAAESNRAVHEADLVLNEFRQQLRTELRAQANRGRVSADTVSLLRTRLADVRSEVLRSHALTRAFTGSRHPPTLRSADLTSSADGVVSGAVTREGDTPPAELKSPKNWIIGDPLPTERLEGQLLPKHLALPIFASDPLSSVAYAPQELVMILLVGGLAFLSFAPWVALAVVVLLITVVASYRQLIRAYPSGGGDYEVAHRNLGEKSGLVVASALLVDYVMTVVVSVASGVDNIISAIPELNGWRVELAVVFVIALAAVNLRGVSESSKAFAIPTYLFIGSVFVMVIVGLVRTLLGDPPIAESAQYSVQAESLGQAAVILLLLRSFASGCSALTGVEAISNGVPAFRRPKIRNAQSTLVLMGGIAITLFAGLTALALISGVHYAEVPCHLIGWEDCATEPQLSLIAQVASATFGGDSILFYVIQASTALVLLLAANTAFNGFPLLGSVLAKDGYAPKSLSTRGDRLIYSNGVIILALAATIILVIFQANLTVLIQLYIIGVFVSFTLGQTGMVRHWLRELSARRHPAGKGRPGRPGPKSDDERPLTRGAIVRALVINAIGAAMTAVVLIVVTVTKFTHGAWIVFIMMPILFFLMMGVHRYYRDVEKEIEVDPTTTFGASGDHAVVLVGRMQKPTLKALDYAIAARHDSIEAVHVSLDEEQTKQLKRDWVRQNIHVKLRILSSPYRDLSYPLLQYLKQHREEHGAEVITVYMPQFIVGHWWEGILHNHKARRIRQKLLLLHGVTVALVPWLLDSSDLIYGRRSRPLPGQDRRGEPVRPVPRRPRTDGAAKQR